MCEDFVFGNFFGKVSVELDLIDKYGDEVYF